MKTIVCWFFIFVFSARAMSQEAVVNDANAQKRAVGNFTAINVSGGIELYLSQGPENALAVSASDSRYRDRIKTEVEGNTLKIWYDGRDWGWTGGGKGLRAYISFKQIDRLEASGGSDTYVKGKLTADRLDLHLSGGSDFKGALEAGELQLHLSGGSDVDLKGRADKLIIDASGASDTRGDDFITQYCDAIASGASDISITVAKEINAVASGSSDIRIKGDGVIKKMSSSGSGSIKKVQKL